LPSDGSTVNVKTSCSLLGAWLGSGGGVPRRNARSAAASARSASGTWS